MNTQQRKPLLLIVSGKKGAGKDTMAPLVADRLDVSLPVHMACADPLKDIVDEFMTAIRNSPTQEAAADAVGQVDPELPQEFRQVLVELLFDAVHADPREHSRSHSQPAVRALQLYGTEFRRAQDPDYWVKIAARRAQELIDEGKFPYITDARFPNEVLGLSAIGGLSVRLDVDPDEQARRLRQRDGRVPSFEELNHPSETALDDYDDFDIRVESDGVQHTLDQIMDRVSA